MDNEQPPHPTASSDSGRPPEVSAPGNRHELAACRRMEIEEKPKLKLHLKEWAAQLKEELLKIETYRNRCIAVKAELYQHMSFYILFQVVVLGALSNGNKLTCETSLFPASFSILTSVATAFSVHYKLGYYKIEKLKFITAEGLNQDLINKINLLKNTGEKFKFQDIIDSSQKKQDIEADPIKWYYRAVMFYLFVFSSVILASCIFVLCFDAKEQKLRLCALHKCRQFALA